MKKLYFLLFLLLAKLTADAAVATIYATALTGSYKTGYVYHSGATSIRYDNSMYIGDANFYRAYSVFDLSSIPAGSTITSVVVGFYKYSTSGAGATAWNTYGYAGDLSTVTTAATLWTDIGSGTLINTATYGTGTGSQTLPTTVATQTFVQSNIGSKISVCFTVAGGTTLYYLSGETTAGSTTAAPHAPFITVTYCDGVTGLAASANPTSLCAGRTIDLTGVVTGGDTAVHWYGPGGYTSSHTIDSVTGTTIAASGIYSFVATDATGCQFTATTNVTVLPAPTPITGLVSPLCAMVHDTLHETVTGGTWTTSPPGFANIDSITTTSRGFTGLSIVTGVDTIKYTLPDGCSTTSLVTVNAFPSPIMGGPPNDTMCIGSTFTLSDTAYGDTGVWVSAVPTVASISPTGVVHTLLAGAATVFEYTNPATGCGPATLTIQVAKMPSFIAGLNHICIASVDTLRDSVAGGLWTSSDPFVGTVSTDTGWLTGYNAGNAVITYTLPGNCYRVFPVHVTGIPGPIEDNISTCIGQAFNLLDTMGLGSWTSSNPSVATISVLDSIHGTVTGLAVGTTTVTYASCGYNVTAVVTVNPNPAPIVGRDSVCVNDTVMLSDATGTGIWQSKYDSIGTAAAAFGIITGIHRGIDTIYYRLPDGCYTKIHFFVDSLPAPITGNLVLCSNSYTSLSDVTAGGKWYSLNTSIAKANLTSGEISGVAAGFDTIVYKAGIGCKATTIVTLNPRPGPVVGDTIMCSQDSMIVTDVTPGGLWSSSNTAVFTVDPMTGNVVSIDTNRDSAYIIYTLTATGCADSMLVVKRAAPHPNIYYNGGLGEGNTDSILNGMHIIAYQWYDATTIGLIPGAISNSLAFLYNETYYVIVEDSFGCYGSSPYYTNTTAGVGVLNMQNEISIYPNPATEKLHILALTALDAEIVTMDGKLVRQIKNAGTIDVSALPSGEYQLILTDKQGDKVAARSFIKE